MATTVNVQREEPVEAGIARRHGRRCKGGKCGCPYRAEAFDVKTGKRIRKSLPSLMAARRWRRDIQREIERGLKIGDDLMIEDALLDLLDRIERGGKRSNRGTKYAPQTIRSYRQAINLHLIPALKGVSVQKLSHERTQRMVGQWDASGASPSAIRNRLDPLHVMVAEQMKAGRLLSNPLTYLELPANRHASGRQLSTQDVAALLAAAPDVDRTIWTTAAYSGLRIGEIQALTWDRVNWDAGLIEVTATWTDTVGPTPTKTKAGTRLVPVLPELRRALLAHWMVWGRPTEGLVFPLSAERREVPFNRNIYKRANRSWKAAGLERVRPHDLRHHYATMLVAAGVDLKTTQTVMGHANVATTLDIYASMASNGLEVAAEKLTAYLGEAAGQ